VTDADVSKYLHLFTLMSPDEIVEVLEVHSVSFSKLDDFILLIIILPSLRLKNEWHSIVLQRRSLKWST